MNLVEIPNDCGFLISLEYKKQGYQNAIDKCLVQKEVLNRLIEAKKYLPDNITFKIWDAYRPFALQEELYSSYKEDIIKMFNLKNMPLEKQNAIISQYVACPSLDNIPAHVTGGAIDLTLVYTDTNEELDMGCCFDDFSNLTNTNAFDNIDNNVSNNRHMLVNAMEKAGFTNLDSEYWHFDFGNQNWANKTGNKPIYTEIC